MARVDTFLSWSLEISQRKKAVCDGTNKRTLLSRQFSLDSLIQLVIGLTGGHCSLLQSRDRRSWRLTRQDQLVLAQQETVRIDADRGPDIVLPIDSRHGSTEPSCQEREGKTLDMDLKTPPPQKITCINKWKDQAFHIKENGGSIQKLILAIRKNQKGFIFSIPEFQVVKLFYQSNMKSLHSSAREKV